VAYDDQAGFDSAVLGSYARLRSRHRAGPIVAPDFADSQYLYRRNGGVRAVPLRLPLLWIPLPSLPCTSNVPGRVDLKRPPGWMPEVRRRHGRADESFTKLRLNLHDQ
jgi:hypothetical protein